MSRVEDRLAELGLSLPPVVTPLAAYTPAVLEGNLLWTSGQLPMVDGALLAAGVVADPDAAADPGTARVTPERAKELAGVCALNALAAAHGVLGDLDRVRRVVKLVGFVASTPGFTGQPAVVNGASELLGSVFGDAGVHARSAVGVAALPLGSPVEVELVLAVS